MYIYCIFISTSTKYMLGYDVPEKCGFSTENYASPCFKD